MSREKLKQFLKSKESIIILGLAFTGTFLASVLVSWGLGVHSVNTTFQHQLDAVKSAQEMLSLHVQQFSKDILRKQAEIILSEVDQKSRIHDLETGSMNYMTQIRSLEVETENIKRKQDELKNSVENELATSLQALNNTLKEWITLTEEKFDKNNEINAELQEQNNRLDLNKRLIDEQSARLLNTTSSLTEVSNEFRNVDDSLSDKLINLEVQFAQNNKVLSTVQDNYESLVIRSELVNQQVVKFVDQQTDVNGNTTASVEKLKESLIMLVSTRADKMVDDLRLAFNAQQKKAKSDQQNMTTTAVESLRKEVKSLVYATVGYESIPGAGQFHIPKDARTWIDAKSYCESKLGFLVEFVNRDLEEKVKNYVRTHYEISTFWLGARDHHTEGVFKWESRNQRLNDLYTNWGRGEPNNHANKEDCAEFSSGIWNDLDCSESRRFICQLKSSQ